MRDDGLEGGPAGLDGLFWMHRAELRRFLAARCGSVDDADDLMQDLWLRLSAARPGPIANGRAYLFRMANNLALDAARGRRRAMMRDRSWLTTEGADLTVTIEDRPDTAAPADEQVAQRQESDLLIRAITALPAGAQQALRLHRLGELSQAEVAQAMGISRSGVEKHLALAMKHLRKALGDCGWFASAASGQQKVGAEGEVRRETKP